MTSVTAAITRIAYITSDVLIHSGPAQQHSDPFQSVIPSTTHHPSAIIPLQVNADAAHHILKAPSTTALITVTLSSAEVLTRLLPHLPSFASTPLVIHALIEDDISSVLALRNVIPYIIYSSTAQLAHDHALLAARLARTERKPVLHFFHAHPETVDEVSEDKVPPFLVAEKRPHATVNGHTHSNGHVHPNGDTHVESPPETDELFAAYESASLSTLALVRHALRPFIYTGAAHPSTLLISLGSLPPFPSHDIQDTSLLSISLLRPFPPLKLIHAIPASVNRVIVLEQVHSNGTKWAPLYLDVLSAYQVKEQDKRPEIIPAIIGNISPSDNFTNTLRSFLHHSTPHVLGTLPPTLSRTTIEPPHVPAHEQSYTALLHHLFPTRLEIANAPELVRKHGEAATRPEFALGRVRAQLESREELVEFVKTLVIQDPHANTKSIVLPELHDLLAKWLTHKDDPIQSESLSKKIIPLLSKSTPTPEITRALALSAHFTSASRWIIGSDAWSYDLGSSGLHHLISSSGLNVNILLLDTQPYSTRQKSNSKKDAGLYAMNHGDVYVASIAVYSSYSQALQALGEADKFNGPSVVLAYLPYESESTPALEVLKETKLAVDTGYWPLYRWNPSNTKEPFSLDSEAIKQEVKDFLDRQNHLSQLSSTTPQLASELVGSLGAELKDARAKRAKEAFDKLVNSMEGPSVAILYASDGGNAEKIAKRLAARAKARGLSVIKTETLDSSGGLTEIANLATEGEGATILFVTSTAGQGEPPQNGRDTFKALNAAFAKSEKPFEHPEKKFKFGVFGMGDTHYWPRPEDKGYYNKPGKDLDLRLEQLGGERFIPLGLGDDQDADGFQTGYKIWEPLVWKALGVDSVEVTEAEPEPITNEHIKIASNYLRGTIKEGLADTSTGALAPSDGQLTKFHGIYEQDDRDVRDERKDQGLEPAYAFMIRVRMPGGVCKPEQWLAMDRIADERGNGTFKLTTRQTFQFHGVIKKHLKPSIQAINKALLDTIAACGDVNRCFLLSFVLCSELFADFTA
jgi:sulfite reductase (NADPH) hemoprotein beta-component